MHGATSLYEGEITEAWARPRSGWRRRRAAMLLVELDDSGRSGLTAKSEVEGELARAGLAYGGPVVALWSRGFCLYLCHAADGALSAVRFVDGHGEVHLAPASVQGGTVRLQSGRSCDTTHSLNIREPGETLQLVIDVAEAGRGFAYAATFLARRRPVSRWSMWRAAASRFGGLGGRVADVMACCEGVQPQPEERRLAA
ncbi:hypothetical protein [Phenylobacterium sp.]|jgi:hypothetical protein|uniref:hypothetical protein n=1 Tax=Phenylobacterium sp. TaxID=1871053 RepID=UPI002F91C6D3